MSESKIYRLFRSGIGLSPKEFLTDVRLNLARTRLVDSDDTIVTVAAECGFPSPGRALRALPGPLRPDPRRLARSEPVEIRKRARSAGFSSAAKWKSRFLPAILMK